MTLSAARVQADRFGTARQAAEQTGAVIVLKGAGTVVTEPGGPPWVNLTGNPGMACGGMGDVLSGLLGGLLARGLAPLEAARLAVYLHGRAADLAARRASQESLTAGDVASALPGAFTELTSF
ncbi:MAG: bifunctional ADP-dependent NAD(P)H-hydrate dehydratase/NAD(P)H-hydrate epimerase, partial [Lentisphaerae bacterium]|nr:bifunctional ADP-dependent NAD(P)H-hydrate dehydratase/NAD(P)H-hydrate epimerase [Lentisphaerota bacterium]